MTVLRLEVRRGSYADSIVLMELQATLAELPGVEEAGAVMASPANLELLRDRGLLGAPPEAGPEDLVLAIRAESAEAAGAALAEAAELLRRPRGGTEGAFRPRSLAAAVRALPAAAWVAVSVPGRWATRVAREALELGRNVFLYSDNVALEDEVALKDEAARRGLLVMGPDCGTAVVCGVGLGFANRVRRGEIGLVAASGTGLQVVASSVHQLGGGISCALGTGGRDLGEAVAARSALRALDLLARDPDTRVIVLLGKPPAPAPARRLLAAAAAAGKPVVVWFQGYAPPGDGAGAVRFAAGPESAAERAVALAAAGGRPDEMADAPPERAVSGSAVRGLFAGGTLALEAARTLTALLGPVSGNVTTPPETPGTPPGTPPVTSSVISSHETAGTSSSSTSSVISPVISAREKGGTSRGGGHSVVDLGADEYTVGRLHPMLDPAPRAEMMRREAADPGVGTLLLDLVLGDGSHPDPAAVLAPAVAAAGRPGLEIVFALVGTDEDPQGLEVQAERLTKAGAVVCRSLPAALGRVVARHAEPPAAVGPPVPLEALTAPPAVINVGLESFAASLARQGAEVVHVEWQPPAGGDARLLAILEKMKG